MEKATICAGGCLRNYAEPWKYCSLCELKEDHGMVDTKKEIRKQLDYAVNSRSHDLLYQTLGYINACRALEAISSDDYVELSSECCRQINTPERFLGVKK